MNVFTFSRRLYGNQASTLFLLYTLSVLLTIADNLNVHSGSMVVPTLLVVVFALTGTLGWRAALRGNSPRQMGAYFAAQLAIFTTLFMLEIDISGGGAASGNLGILLLLQSSILPWRSRLLIYGLICLGMAGVSLLYLPLVFVVSRTAVFALTGGVVLLIGYLIVSEERARRDLNAAHRQLAEYAAQVEELATVRERNRLAREIHDNLGHYLTIVNVQIEAAVAVMPSNPEKARLALLRAQGLTKEGLGEIRKSVAALRAAPTDVRPLHEALLQLVEEGLAAGLDIDYQIAGTVRACSAQIELALYRIAQEGLTNIRKHAQARHAHLTLDYGAEGVRLRLQDDGQGSSQTGGGFGLTGVRERVRLLDGALNIRSAPGQGFTLEVEIPG